MSRVAVIGAGALGLMAIKNLREEGFDVTGFEKRGYVGGLWNPTVDGSITAMPETVFNSSRFRSAIPDFPFADDVNDFPTAKQLWAYLESYCDHFHLRPHINFNAKVTDLQRQDGRWALKYSSNGEDAKVEHFDRVLVATGSFTKPKQPNVKGIEKFQGKVIHSIEYRKPQDYKGQNVMLIGLHATSQDITKELEPHASKVYITHRNGVNLLPRYLPSGQTFDQTQNIGFFFFQEFAQRYFPNAFNWLVDTAIAKMSRTAFPGVKAEWKLWPAPSLATTSPLIADDIWPHLESGFAEPVSAVSEILSAHSVKLTDDRVINDIDTIIFCTGYDFSVPFIPAEFNPYPSTGAPPNLYQHIFPLHPDPAVRNTLAFLGQAAIPFPGFVMHELLGLAVCEIWKGTFPLPSLSSMQSWHKSQLAWRHAQLSRQATESTFYVCFLRMPPFVRWLDRVCGTGMFVHFGWLHWRAWRLWWSDRKFYGLLKSGLFSPAIWRCFDMGYGRKVWRGAKGQVKVDNLLAEASAKVRLARLEQEKVEISGCEMVANGHVDQKLNGKKKTT